MYTICAVHRMALWEENHKWFLKEFSRLFLAESDLRGLLVPTVEVDHFDDVPSPVLSKGGEEIAAGLDVFVAKLDDDVALAKPGFVGRATRLHAPNADAVIDREIELLRKGRRDLLDSNAEKATLDAALID